MYTTHKYALALSGLFTMTALACSGTATSSSSSGSIDEDSGTTSTSSSSSSSSSSSGDVDSGSNKPDAAEAMPTSPLFDLTINGAKMVVKAVKVTPANRSGVDGQSVSSYTIEAKLSQTPAIAAGLDGDPRFSIEISKDDVGGDICKTVYGPTQGFLTPTIQIRKVSINYKRFTGQVTKIAVAATGDKPGEGSCNMNVKTSAKTGNAWGDAKGSVQAGTDEPSFAFDVKWFQTFTW